MSRAYESKQPRLTLGDLDLGSNEPRKYFPVREVSRGRSKWFNTTEGPNKGNEEAPSSRR